MREIKIELHELIIGDRDSGDEMTIFTLQTVQEIAKEICGRESERVKDLIEDEYETMCIQK